jgi:uncharacterized membrane protein
MNTVMNRDISGGLVGNRTIGLHLLMCGIVALLATLIMIPRISSPNFGLLDDGVTLAVSSSILREAKAGNWKFVFGLERDRGRFRPFYWLYYASLYSLFGPNPSRFFVSQWLSLILTGLVIYGIVWTVVKDHFASLFSGLAYVLSPTTFENYYTLSKPEPPLVLWLTLSVFFFLRSVAAFDAKQKYNFFFSLLA